MCGRFTLSINELDFEDRFSRDKSFRYKPVNNVVPTQEMPIITSESDMIIPAYWGLPSSFKNKIQINARAETITQLPSFKHLIKHKRCIIPADSFIEWDKSALHQPYRIMLSSRKVFCFAGIYNLIEINGINNYYFTIITTEANSQMKWLHNRMPLIIEESQEANWLSEDKKWKKIIHTIPQIPLYIYPISPRINNSKANSPDLLLPIDKPLTLF